MKIKLLLSWAYISEVVAESLAYKLIGLLFDDESVSSLLTAKSIDIATLFAGIMFAAALGFLWTYYSKSDSPFSCWLHSKGAYAIYLKSYIFTSAALGFLTLLLVITSNLKHPYLIKLSAWMTIYCLIISVTFIKNIYSQLILNMEFNKLTK